MVHFPRLAWISALLILSSASAMGMPPPEAARVKHWAALLPETPRGLGPTIKDRKAWEIVGAAPSFKHIIPHATQLLAEPIPPLTDELYLDYSRTGNRTRCEKVQGQRQDRISTLVLAECIENRGRFLPAIEEAIRATCSDKSWTSAAHDWQLVNFKGTGKVVDLRSANLSWNLATALYWLGDKLRPEVRNLVRDELERRTFTPFTDLISGKPPTLSSATRMWWLTTKNNWNAVCLAGVTGSALATVESRDRRALFAAAAEKYIQFFLEGFTPDGYCSEGLGYWNYGFGHYVMLAETLHQATGGKEDFLALPSVPKIAQFGRRMEILPGIFPAFADCNPDTRPDPQLMAMLSRRYGWGLTDVEARGLGTAVGPHGLFATGLYNFPNSATAAKPAKNEAARPPLRDWFADAQVLIARPALDSAHALGVAIKGGHNNEQHNHNDVGSFMVALGKSTPLLDPGREVYTARTFGPHRYDSKLLNSFGHPVPRVAGRLQETGRKFAAKILKTDFTDTADTLVLDLSAAYDVKPLKKLERTFQFSRTGNSQLTVTDAVEFDSPQTFGTALITFGPWKSLAPDRLQVGTEPDAVTVQIAVEGGRLKIAPEEIREDMSGGRKPTRLGIELTEPAARATITLTITPCPASK